MSHTNCVYSSHFTCTFQWVSRGCGNAAKSNQSTREPLSGTSELGPYPATTAMRLRSPAGTLHNHDPMLLVERHVLTNSTGFTNYHGVSYDFLRSRPPSTVRQIASRERGKPTIQTSDPPRYCQYYHCSYSDVQWNVYDFEDVPRSASEPTVELGPDPRISRIGDCVYLDGDDDEARFLKLLHSATSRIGRNNLSLGFCGFTCDVRSISIDTIRWGSTTDP